MVIIHKKHKESAEEKNAREQKEREQAIGIQDQYQARGFELVSWVQDHKGLVTSLIAIVIVGGALFSGYLYYQKRTAEIASGAFLEALKGLDIGGKTEDEENVEKQKKAQAELSTIAASYKGTGVSVMADLYAGHLALENNDAKAGVEHYEKAVNNVKKTDVLYPLALIGLGYSQEKNGNAEDALKSFETVINLKDSFGKDLALWEAARLAKESKDDSKAKKYTAQLLEEFPASVYEQNAKKLNEALQ